MIIPFMSSILIRDPILSVLKSRLSFGIVTFWDPWYVKHEDEYFLVLEYQYFSFGLELCYVK